MEDHPVILFDGVCNFCDSAINFIIRHDQKGIFRFAPLQSEAGQKILQQYSLPTSHFDSFILIDKDRIYKRSSAALKISAYLPLYWKWTQILWIIPPFIRDAAYNIVARNRYKWFGKKDQCMIPTADVRSRFLA